jgi:hypothetical protein
MEHAAEVERRLRARLRGMGDTTLTIEEFANFWKGSSGSLTDAEPPLQARTWHHRDASPLNRGQLARWRRQVVQYGSKAGTEL